MSAREHKHEGTTHSFVMDLPVPAYLTALAIGELAVCGGGPTHRIYAEPPVLAAAAHEFEDTERLIQTVEAAVWRLSLGTL